jgi:hypothetical protein
MASNVRFDDRGPYVRCHYVGPFELVALLELTRAIRDYCTEHAHRRVLVDLRDSQGALSTLERYEHAVVMARDRTLSMRIAIVARPDQAYADRFWETMTRNRGLVTHVTTDEAEARRWLEIDEG